MTLTGVGGVGKTRLAIQVGAELLARYSDGAWLCELGPLGDPDAVPDMRRGSTDRPTTTRHVDERQHRRLTRRQTRPDRARQLRARDRGRGADLANAVLQACPDVRILATSREGLGIRGERMVAVRSLDLPEIDGTLDELASTEAVRLFVDRAHEAGGTFHLDESNRVPVAQIRAASMGSRSPSSSLPLGRA